MSPINNAFLNRALHLRFEKGMVGLSFCDFVGTREEKARMAEYRKKEWPRRYKVTYKFISFVITVEHLKDPLLMVIVLCLPCYAEWVPSLAAGPAETEGRTVSS